MSSLGEEYEVEGRNRKQQKYKSQLCPDVLQSFAGFNRQGPVARHRIILVEPVDLPQKSAPESAPWLSGVRRKSRKSVFLAIISKF